MAENEERLKADWTSPATPALKISSESIDWEIRETSSEHVLNKFVAWIQLERCSFLLCEQNRLSLMLLANTNHSGV